LDWKGKGKGKGKKDGLVEVGGGLVEGGREVVGDKKEGDEIGMEVGVELRVWDFWAMQE
jgi:hypothetical protein